MGLQQIGCADPPPRGPQRAHPEARHEALEILPGFPDLHGSGLHILNSIRGDRSKDAYEFRATPGLHPVV